MLIFLFQSEEPVIIMDTDTSSGDLNLILETTNDATSPVVTEPNQKDSENSAKTDSINAKGAKTPSGMETTPSGNRKSESRQGNSSTPTGVKTVPEDGSKGTPSGQPRRIQFITLSKASWRMVFILNEGICLFNTAMTSMCEYDNNDISLVKEVSGIIWFLV